VNADVKGSETVATRSARGRGRPSYDLEDQAAAENFRDLSAGFLLERNSPAPLWVQLKNQIGAAIREGRLPPGSRLPSEQALCLLLEVSRPVVRAAVRALSDEGSVVKLPRKGMFVAPERRQTDFLNANISVFGDMAAKGIKVSTDTLEFYRAPCNARERQVFNLPEAGTVIRIRRMYRMDGHPITLSWISLPGHRVPDMEKLDITNRSLYETLRATYGIEVQRAERWFTAEMPSPEAVKLMKIDPMLPVIVIESISYDQAGEPVEFYSAYYDSNHARIHISV
jgi:GntR family transcriptional regulator